MLNQRHWLVLGYLALAVMGWTSAQSLNIDSCYAMAERNFPLVKQYALIDLSAQYSLENANKGYLPMVNINGQATYQSEVTSIPIALPGISIDPPSKSQFKLYGEVNQPITDLFTVDEKKAMVTANADVESQRIEVETYKLRERINQLFFGILAIEAQIQMTELLKKDIDAGIAKTQVAIANGIALRSSADNLKAELLRADQRIIELNGTRRGYANMLALFINQPINGSTTFERPRPKSLSSQISRPELHLFDLQRRTFDVQAANLSNRNLPRFSLFAQGGLGRPALNMLSNEVKGYFIGGLRLSWNLSSFYTYNKERQILEIQQKGVDIQRDLFLFNTQIQMGQQREEVTKIQALITSDEEIIALRESMKNSIKNQLEYGTATSTDYLNAVNSQDQANQSKVLHEIQLLMAQYNYQTTTGN